jgi:integrase
MMLRQLKAIFQRGMTEYALLRFHSFRAVKPLATPRASGKCNYLTVDQVKALIDGIQDVHFRRLVCFYLWTGCRRTEAVDLTWKDVDWQNGVVYLGQPDSKTKTRRAFPIGDKIGHLLNELTNDRSENLKVFWRFREDASHISQRFQKIRQHVSSLPGNLTTHTLRHTFASHLVMGGVDLMTVASLLGHTTTKTTELYAHLQPDHKKTALSRLPY